MIKKYRVLFAIVALVQFTATLSYASNEQRGKQEVTPLSEKMARIEERMAAHFNSTNSMISYVDKTLSTKQDFQFRALQTQIKALTGNFQSRLELLEQRLDLWVKFMGLILTGLIAIGITTITFFVRRIIEEKASKRFDEYVESEKFLNLVADKVEENFEEVIEPYESDAEEIPTENDQMTLDDEELPEDELTEEDDSREPNST
jgi:phosphoglycerate-specific signal transduction histidine kinase